ncbi:hypothetical protein BT63DRAFT_483118 [Microthyrium microscopicum]|uniref:DUF6594 domain-containing protein n=1 Tax=Microthyrium microscopicum TaxID=703497 RepID=A0A6A6U2T0_9PEZI|nr:hypothetical protein BT63DRAFT_483118 [Microthyrium microscopicum]
MVYSKASVDDCENNSSAPLLESSSLLSLRSLWFKSPSLLTLEDKRRTSWNQRSKTWLMENSEAQNSTLKGSVPGERERIASRITYSKYTEKLRGYPRFAAWLASDPAFSIGRDYASLRTKVRLYKQYKVEEAKAKLDELERVADDHDRHNLDCFEDNFGEEVWDNAMLDLDKALEEFDEIQLRERKYGALSRPSTRNYTSLLDHLELNGELNDDMEDWFLCSNEMVSLSQDAKGSWLDDRLEEMLNYIPFSQKLFTDKMLRLDNNEGLTVRYYRKDRIEVLSRVVAVIIIVLMILAPVGILSTLTDRPKMSYGIVCIFTAVFAVMLSFCTRLGQNEIYMVSATYPAILVVFLSNSQNGICVTK